MILPTNSGHVTKRVNSQPEVAHMAKSVSGSKKPRKQYISEFREEALKLAARIGVAAAARELSLYESQLYVWRLRRYQISPRQQFRLICDAAVL